MPKRKRNVGDFSFDFSALTYGAKDEKEEIPKLCTEPAAFENAAQMAAEIDYDRDYFCFLSGRFIFGELIEALCYKKLLAPTVAYITTLGMSRDNVDSIVNLVDYLGCQKVNLLVSHYFYGTERHGIVPYMMQEFAGRPIDVAVLQSHCKIAILYSDKGNILISGSANLSSSNNVEQCIVMHDPKTIDYVTRKLDGIMKKFIVFSGENSEETPRNNKDNTGMKAFEAIKED